MYAKIDLAGTIQELSPYNYPSTLRPSIAGVFLNNFAKVSSGFGIWSIGGK